ncbi:hypothetical protein [Corynebacterium sp. AOP12-C2-36]|uniref:hypothetical protein n=1 Tax=Corynebacterium sp. AOP12-C2-36 TaxID=3457723 RepID=UPI004034B704
MDFAPIDALSIILGVAGLGIAVYRLSHRDTFPSLALTALTSSLGVAVLLRSPWLGDTIIDGLGHAVTGWWNLPDLIGHICAFIAIAAGITYLTQALMADTPGARSRTVAINSALAVFAIACAAAFVTGGGYQIQAVNMVQLDGMQPYSMLWSACLLAWHCVTAFVAFKLVSTLGWSSFAVALTAAATAGTAMALHRLTAVSFPAVFDFHYGAISWTLAVLTIVGYLSVAVLVTRHRVRSTPTPSPGLNLATV